MAMRHAPAGSSLKMCTTHFLFTPPSFLYKEKNHSFILQQFQSLNGIIISQNA
jgi:hypothetical protein